MDETPSMSRAMCDAKYFVIAVPLEFLDVLSVAQLMKVYDAAHPLARTGHR
jgi:hypothetical protein